MTPTLHGGERFAPSMTRTLSARDIDHSASDPFIEGYTAWSDLVAGEPGDMPLFSGLHDLRHLSSGPVIEVSALTALCASRHMAVMKRSLTLVLVIDGAPLELGVGHRSVLTVGRGQALVIATPDADAVIGIHRKGDSSRCLLLRTRPEDLVDPDLATFVREAIEATVVTRLPAASWSSAMAAALLSPGPIGRLAEESCALGLLAETLRTMTGNIDAANVTISSADRRKMLRVRDLLIAAPDKEHRLADLAREAGVGVTALKTKFTAVFGQSVFAFLRDTRLDRARAGIEHEGWSASQAAYTVGYRNLGGFSDAFRRKFGLLPSDLRRRAKTRPQP